MKYYTTTTEFNCGIDLHTRQMYICVMDRAGNVLVHRNIKNNDFGFFLKLVEPYRHDVTVTCESCFVWWAIPFGHCFRKLKPVSLRSACGHIPGIPPCQRDHFVAALGRPLIFNSCTDHQAPCRAVCTIFT